MKRIIFRGAGALAAVYLTAGCNQEASFASGAKKSYDALSNQVFSFTSSEIIPGSVTIKDGGRYTSFDVTQAEKSPSQVIQRQVRRQRYDHSYVQGHNAKFSREEFQLSEAGYLDFLVVVDDSRSMSEEQTMVGKGLASLISEVKDSNWQIAVISMSDPCVHTSNLIKKTDANPDQKFAAAVQKKVDPKATEQGFPMAIQSLKGQCDGSIRSWIRPGSSVGVLFLSDEENCGSDSGEQARCRNVIGKNTAEMVNFLRSIRPADEARMYAIVDKDGTCPDAGGKGSMYVEATVATGGSAASICHDFDSVNGYGNYLKQVSTDVKRIIKRQFFLSAAPDMGRFEVAVDGVPVSSAGVVSVNGKVVSIDPVAFKEGTQISFSYTHDAIPMFQEVPISVVPAQDTLVVTVNGVTQTLGRDFAVDTVKRVVSFASMPPEDSKVSVSYLENISLLTRFSINLTGVRADTLKVSVNGVAIDRSNYSYDAAGIDFPTPPSDGAILLVSWKTDEHKILKYAASIGDSRHPAAWLIKDKATGVEIPADWDRKFLSFTPDQVIEGRVVSVEVDFGAKSAQRTLDLPDERIDDDVKILADGKAGVCEAAGVAATATSTLAGDAASKDKPWQSRYKGRQVTLKCQEGIDYNELTVNYRHEVARTNKFVVKLPEGADPDDPALGWKVYVDGKVITGFTRDGSEIELEEDLLPPETRVDVEVITYSRIEK
jgi:hypothetical protein